MKHIKIEGETSFVRDVNTGAILNINKNEINAARERKRQRKIKEQELQDLKNDVSEIKELLVKLIEKQ